MSNIAETVLKELKEIEEKQKDKQKDKDKKTAEKIMRAVIK